jgi:hypothetical protein
MNGKKYELIINPSENPEMRKEAINKELTFCHNYFISKL